jgi:hypothetical protein
MQACAAGYALINLTTPKLSYSAGRRLDHRQV